MDDLSLKQIIDSYDPATPLAEAWTIPASWYVDPRVLELERRTLFARSWQLAGRVEQVRKPGQYITLELAGEPLLVVRGGDGVLRGFYNVCRHHAAAVMTDPSGEAAQLRCPYHAWTYSLEGELKSAPDLGAVCNFDRTSMGLVPVETATWEKWVFVRLDQGAPSLEAFLGDLTGRFHSLNLAAYRWFERRHYSFDCNWKVFIDNYLDGGYHVPHLHGGLASILDYDNYVIENGDSYCLQSSPVTKNSSDIVTSEVRGGNRAIYYWIYPNFMVNWYEGVMDTNLVIPRGVSRTEVVFDFFFTEEAGSRSPASIAVSDRIQDEDAAICKSVQRGLASRGYLAGRLSARREAGEHLFHRLLHADLKSGAGG